MLRLPLIDSIKSALCGKRVFVVGCGGLGGYVISELARTNVSQIGFADGDVFSESNLNRQLYSSYHNIGKNKAAVVAREIKKYSSAQINQYPYFISEENIASIIGKCDVIIDACDNSKTRLLLEKYADENNLFIIHGAINGVFGQIAIVPPKSGLLSRIYTGDTQNYETLAYVPAVIASIEVSEAIKLLTNTKSNLYNKVMFIDLINNDFIIKEI